MERCKTKARRCDRRHGSVMLYVIVALPVLAGFAGLAIDVGRMQVSKTEAQTCADAAARYAAMGAANSYSPAATAIASAMAVAAQASVDGGAPTINAAEVIVGNFDSITRTFTATNSGNCVKVTVRQTLNRSGGMPLMMSIFPNGSAAFQVTATAIARCTATTTTINPPASGNLWLSGMPDNTQTQNLRPDANWVWDNNGTTSNPKQRPPMVDLAALGLTAGATINLEGISGNGSWQDGSSSSTNTADGDSTFIVANGVAPAGSLPSTSSNGLSNTRAPIGAIMGVFLSDSDPSQSAPPANLDFGRASDRDFTSVSPRLKQVFFIGDGKRSNGETQSIIIPTGTTKLYLGMMDAWQWNDNVGTFTTKLYGNNAVTLVK